MEYKQEPQKDDALDAFYDCTAEDEWAAGISTTGGGAEIFIIEK